MRPMTVALLLLALVPLPVDAQKVPPVGPSKCVTCDSGGSSGGSGLGPGGSRLTKPTPSTPVSPSTPGSSSGSTGGGGRWDSGSGSSSVPSSSTDAAWATAVNNEGVDLYTRGQFEAALRKYLEAQALNPHDPVIERNVRKARALVANREAVAAFNRGDYTQAVQKGEEALAQWPAPNEVKVAETIKLNLQEAREELEKQRQARATEEVQKGIERLNDVLRAGPGAGQPSGGLDFMKDAPAPVVIGRPPATSAPPQTLFDKGTPDASVVNLQNARTSTIDPRTIQGQSQGLQFMTGLDRTKVPTPAESEAARRYAEWRESVLTSTQSAVREERLQRELGEALQRLERNAAARSNPLPREEALKELRQELAKVPEELRPVVRRAWLQQHMKAVLDQYERSAAARSESVSREQALEEIRKALDRLPEESRAMLGPKARFDKPDPIDEWIARAGRAAHPPAPPAATGPPGPGLQWPGPRNPEPPLPNPLWQDGKTDRK